MEFISKNIEEYASLHSSAEPGVLQRLSRETQAKILKPRMLSGHLQGRLLSFISRLVQPRYILEIGTYTAYSAICLAEGLQKGGLLHTIDHNAELEEFAAKYIKEAGYAGIIVQHIGEALEVLPGLDSSFDLVFIDADKENYVNYFKLIFPKLRKGGIVLADNALWSGKVCAPEEEMDDETRGIHQFNTFIRAHDGVRHLLLPFRDGLMMIEKTAE